MLLGEFDHIDLQARHVGEGEEPERGQGDERPHWRMRREGEGEEDHGLEREEADQRPDRIPVGNAAAGQVANRDGRAVEDQDQAHARWFKAGHLLQDRGQEREGHEGAAVTQRRHGEDQQQAAAAEHPDLIDQAGGGGPGQGGRKQRRDPGEGNDAQARDGPEGGAPTERLADEGAQRHAGHDGHGQAHEHHGDGGGSTVLGHEVGRDGRADGEEDAMGEGGEHAGDQQHLIAGAEGGRDISGDEQSHQAEHEGLARHAPGQRGDDGGAEGHAERVDADDQARKRKRDTEIRGDRRQEADDHEFRSADRIGCDRQGEESKRHDGIHPPRAVRGRLLTRGLLEGRCPPAPDYGS